MDKKMTIDEQVAFLMQGDNIAKICGDLLNKTGDLSIIEYHRRIDRHVRHRHRDRLLTIGARQKKHKKTYKATDIDERQTSSFRIVFLYHNSLRAFYYPFQLFNLFEKIHLLYYALDLIAAAVTLLIKAKREH